jgi:ParB-like chromosome segregation protein Spo0J
MANFNLYWKTEKRRVKDLILFEDNPRRMNKHQAEQLLDSLKKFNLVEIPAIDQNNRVLAGNMRIRALKELGREDDEIDVRVPSRPLSEEEAREYLIRSNKNVGEWNFDLLVNFDFNMLKKVGFDKIDLAKIFKDEDLLYSRKIAVPVYVPSGEKVEVKDLYNREFQLELFNEIERADFLSEELKEFLVLASFRHVIFNYGKIADFYASLKDERIKKLFRKSVLVLVDFDEAVERGWIRLSEDIVEQIKEEYG